MGNQYALLSTPVADNGVYLRHRAGIPRVKGGQIFSCSNYFHALPKLLFLIGTGTYCAYAYEAIQMV